jgi:hypothetical protein
MRRTGMVIGVLIDFDDGRSRSMLARRDASISA